MLRNHCRWFLLPILVVLMAVPAAAQQEGEQEPEKTFTDIRVCEYTPTKDQAGTGTCWCFSAISFLESELLRLDRGTWDLSEMFVVNHVYRDKADYYVRMHGNNRFGPGALGHDVFYTIRDHGIVPEEDYPGLWEYEEAHNHSELHRVLTGYVDGVLGGRGGPTPKWDAGCRAIVDTYLGSIPDRIQVEGRTLTPEEFADDVMGLDMSDYVEITSFSHMPFYETVCLLVPDNWVRDPNTWNLPVDDVMRILENSLRNGYTAVYGGDVSERSFDQEKGYATWREGETISQEDRQEMWDRWTTTDDHGMHVVGISQDEEGTTFYRVKNSWGPDEGPHGGHIYMSENFIRAKFDLITVHVDTIPDDIRAKMALP
ncbi:MAG: C1 family peptidase [bacterium]